MKRRRLFSQTKFLHNSSVALDVLLFPRTWSVEGYVGEIRNGNQTLKIAMANALLTYGDSVAACFAAQ